MRILFVLLTALCILSPQVTAARQVAEVTVTQDGVFLEKNAGDVICLKVGVRVSMPGEFDPGYNSGAFINSKTNGQRAIMGDLQLAEQFSAQRAQSAEPVMYLIAANSPDSAVAASQQFLKLGFEGRTKANIAGPKPPSGFGETAFVIDGDHIKVLALMEKSFATLVDPNLGVVAQIRICEEE